MEMQSQETQSQPDEMKLTHLVDAWLKEEEWEDEIKINHANKTSRVRTGITHKGTDFLVFIEVDEEQEWLFVFCYTPFAVSKERFAVAYELLNRINLEIALGRFAINSKGEFQFSVAADQDGAEFTPRVIGNLMDAAMGACGKWVPALAKLVYTQLTVEQILKEDKDVEENQVTGTVH